ncbi:hypothetical protein I7I48_09743 [Histoplasma ohiense]|nr:hypothetical protein I7I48_09743 [Histoplasma ohiense (nom. inval.)]
MNKFCNETGVGIIPWTPLSSGYLTRPASEMDATVRGGTYVLKRDLDGQEKAILQHVWEIADKRRWTMGQVPLSWLNKRIASLV